MSYCTFRAASITSRGTSYSSSSDLCEDTNRMDRLHQDWSQERVKYAELQADNWRVLCNEVEEMPLGE